MHDMMFQGIQFPEAPGRRDEQATPPPSDDNRVTVGEIVFLGPSAGHDQDHDDNNIHGSKTIRVSVEKDNSHGEEAPRPGLDVDCVLHLFTANAGSDQSMVVDGISSDAKDKPEDPKVKLADAENKLAKSESLVAKLQTELQRMNLENRLLKDRLAQVTNNYSVLPMNPVAFMQQQQNQGAADTTQDHEVVESKSEERKHEINVNGGAGSPADQMDEVSHASSEDRTISGSPRNACKNREGKRVRLEESPESESQGWNNRNKIPKLNPSKAAAIDQSAEATMMKPSVSDRARSEDPMVSQDMGPSQLAHHSPQCHQQPPHQPQQPQLSLADIVSTIKAAIIADPNFTAGLATTISSSISGAHSNNNIDNNNNKINDNNNDNNNNKINNNNNNNTTTNISFSSDPSSAKLIQRTETIETTTTKVTTTIYPFSRDKFIRL